MREVHTNPQTTSAGWYAIFYICQQKPCPALKATTDYYISSMVYRKQGKANRVIQVERFSFSPPLPSKHTVTLRENKRNK
jgi:hypothetical protein